MPQTDPKNIRPAGACAIVFDDTGRVLLHRRSDNGQWVIPGGAIEKDETAEAAAIREAKEETGYDVRALRLVGVYSNPADTTVQYPDGNVKVWVVVMFECRLIGGKPELSDETLEVGWFPPDKFPDNMRPSHIIRIRDALQKREAAFYPP